MDERFSTWTRLGLVIFGLVLVALGFVLGIDSSGAAASAGWAFLGVLVVYLGAIGRPPFKFGATSAEWRDAAEMVRRELEEGAAPGDEVTGSSAGSIADDAPIGEDSVDASIIRAGHASSASEFASAIAAAIRGARSSSPSEEYWAEPQHVGTASEDFYFTVDFRNVGKAHSTRIAEQAAEVATEASRAAGGPSTISDVFSAISRHAMTRAESLPFGGPATVVVMLVGAREGHDSAPARRDEVAALAANLANDHENPDIADFWRRVHLSAREASNSVATPSGP